MSPIEEIRGAIDLMFEGRTREVCLSLVDEIRTRLDEPEKLWTYQVFSRWLDVPVDVVVPCVDFLATARNARLLSVHFLVFDPSDPDDVGARLPDEDAKAAYSTGTLYHPETEERITHFEEWLVPYFMPDERAAEALRT